MKLSKRSAKNIEYILKKNEKSILKSHNNNDNLYFIIYNLIKVSQIIPINRFFYELIHLSFYQTISYILQRWKVLKVLLPHL